MIVLTLIITLFCVTLLTGVRIIIEQKLEHHQVGRSTPMVA